VLVVTSHPAEVGRHVLAMSCRAMTMRPEQTTQRAVNHAGNEALFLYYSIRRHAQLMYTRRRYYTYLAPCATWLCIINDRQTTKLSAYFIVPLETGYVK